MDMYEQQVYSGILGKLIGVYFGRPVEGWPYERIRERFGRITHYVNEELDMPLHVPDDDLSGTFTFIRTLEDNNDLENLADKAFGETWLDYVIENKTIFWWGGLGRSTEHTAYLRLKAGYLSPESGSIALNGQAIAEQIGAQIFMDGFALMCPGDPIRARKLVRSAASVSHDGIAVESACFLATLESLAFSIKIIDELLDGALVSGSWSDRIKAIVSNVRLACETLQEWRKVREWLQENYGYHLFPGNCHVIPNLALLLSSLLLGGDSFRSAMEIVVSSGWDTDCNAANLGCINGIRLGLDAITKEYDYRTPIADRFYCISSLGEACVTDAIVQTRKIVLLHARLYRLSLPDRKPRFGFEMPGSVQGFTVCPILNGKASPACNANTLGLENGIYLSNDENCNEISTLTMWDPADRYGGYELLGSPTLYSGQTIHASLTSVEGNPIARLYVIFYDLNDALRVTYGDEVSLQGEQSIYWIVPDSKGMPISRVGVQLVSNEERSAVILTSLDWLGAPRFFSLSARLQNLETTQPTMALQAFTSSAKQFSFDKRYTLAVSHPEEDGIVDMGTSQWIDYRLTATVVPNLHTRCGLVARTHGHRRYYAALLEKCTSLLLVRREGDQETVLSRKDFSYALNMPLEMDLTCNGKNIEVQINGQNMVAIIDGTFSSGGAGFLVSKGTMMVEKMTIESLEEFTHV